ncbi:MAG: polysaccharide deacetylase family protein [Thermoguttaceae bacterium]
MTGLIRRGTKAALVAGLYALGHGCRIGGVPIFCYHSIDDSGSLLSVSPSMFRRQMAYLKERGYRTMALGRLCQDLEDNRPLPRKTVVLTFDDGYRNNYEQVMPILQEFGFTGTVFVVTGHVGGRMDWNKTPGVPDLQMASWEELRAMADAGLDIQAHTKTHPNLCRLTPEAAREEIGDSKEELENRLGKPVTLFAYPYGEHNSRIEQIVERLGFLGAVTAIVGRTHPGDGPQQLKRVNVTEISRVGDATRMLFFKCCAMGTSSWYSGMKQWLPMLVRPHRPWENAATEGAGDAK